MEANDEKYAQVRMIAKIKNINEKRLDLDTGKIYDRKLVNASNVKNYLKYNDKAGNMMINDAVYMANKKYIFSESDTDEQII